MFDAYFNLGLIVAMSMAIFVLASPGRRWWEKRREEREKADGDGAGAPGDETKKGGARGAP